MSEGISPNSLNDISKVYLDQIAAFREIRKQETQKDIERWSQPAKDALQKEEVQVDEEKKSLPKLKMYRKAGNLARAGDEESMKRQTKMVSVLNKETSKGYKKAALDKLRDGGSPKHQTESLSDWRNDLYEIADLREVIDKPETEGEAQKEVKEKKVKNTIKINPTIPEAAAVVAEIGGELLSVEENCDTIESVVEYFYEEGINEEGIDLLIEEIGLDEFVDFVEGGAVELNEERAARRATVRAKSYADVKAAVDKSDAAKKKAKKGEYAPSYAKKETDVTVYDDKPSAKKKAPAGMKKAVARKKEVLKQPVKKVAPKPVAKKVQKAVAKVKPAQPKKPASKQTLRDKITTAYKAGVKRHKKAVQPARVFGKGFKRGVTDTVKFAKKAKKAVVGEEVGVSSSAAMEKARQEAKLKAKEEAAVKKAKNVKEEEAKKKGLDGKECWDGYKLAGTKKKGGKTVDNCVKVSEDKAFDNVVGALRKKHGESGVLTKDSPKPKAKPLDAKQIWRRDDRNAVQREVDAQYGRTPWNKKGSLGT